MVGGAENYDWSEMQSQRSDPPPIKLMVRRNGKIVIVDGNHRINFWREGGYEYFPAWVIDYRQWATGT
jgi:hypothetical protein